MNRHTLLFFLLISLLAGCGESDYRPGYMQGSWHTIWSTLPGSFEGMDNITSFEMDGQFIFDEDSVTIIANGFPGCVFGADTLSHTQGWKMSGDSLLHLVSENNVVGITYQVSSRKDGEIKLQLMEDIFLKLEKDSQ